MDKDYCLRVASSQVTGGGKGILKGWLDLFGFDLRGSFFRNCSSLPDDPPNQHLGFQYGAIGKVQPKRGTPDLLVLGIGHEEINRIAGI
jgi:hypothetical protein